jgi:hypothetical protein
MLVGNTPVPLVPAGAVATTSADQNIRELSRHKKQRERVLRAQQRAKAGDTSGRATKRRTATLAELAALLKKSRDPSKESQTKSPNE